MIAINRKQYERLENEFGSDINFESNNSFLSEITAEIANENRKPFNIHSESASDEGVNAYFENNTYAYVKFSK